MEKGVANDFCQHTGVKERGGWLYEMCHGIKGVKHTWLVYQGLQHAVHIPLTKSRGNARSDAFCRRKAKIFGCRQEPWRRVLFCQLGLKSSRGIQSARAQDAVQRERTYCCIGHALSINRVERGNRVAQNK